MNPSDQARQIGVVNSWLGQYRVTGVSTNPSNDTVVWDTGALAAGYYDVFYTLYTTVALGFNQLCVTWRNAANNAYLWLDYILAVSALSQQRFLLGVQVGQNERFRMEVPLALTGTVGGMIFLIRRA